MNLLSKLLFVSAAAVLTLAPRSASALPPDCDVQCVDTPPCGLVCAIPWGMRVMTCEQWFNDYAVGTCTPDAQPPSEEEEELSSVEPRQGNLPGLAAACHATAEMTAAR